MYKKFNSLTSEQKIKLDMMTYRKKQSIIKVLLSSKQEYNVEKCLLCPNLNVQF